MLNVFENARTHLNYCIVYISIYHPNVLDGITNNNNNKKKQQLLSSTGAQKYQTKWNLFIEDRDKMRERKTELTKKKKPKATTTTKTTFNRKR